MCVNNDRSLHYQHHSLMPSLKADRRRSTLDAVSCCWRVSFSSCIFQHDERTGYRLSFPGRLHLDVWTVFRQRDRRWAGPQFDHHTATDCTNPSSAHAVQLSQSLFRIHTWIRDFGLVQLFDSWHGRHKGFYQYPFCQRRRRMVWNEAIRDVQPDWPAHAKLPIVGGRFYAPAWMGCLRDYNYWTMHSLEPQQRLAGRKNWTNDRSCAIR